MAAHRIRVDSDLARFDVEEARLAPGVSPLVLADPVQMAVLIVAPAKAAHGVLGDQPTGRVFIYSLAVTVEILVHQEVHDDWSVLIDVLLYS